MTPRGLSPSRYAQLRRAALFASTETRRADEILAGWDAADVRYRMTDPGYDSMVALGRLAYGDIGRPSVVKLTGSMRLSDGPGGLLNVVTGRYETWHRKNFSVASDPLPLKWSHQRDVGVLTHGRLEKDHTVTFWGRVTDSEAMAGLVWRELHGASVAGAVVDTRPDDQVRGMLLGRLDEISLTDSPAIMGARAGLTHRIPDDAMRLGELTELLRNGVTQRQLEQMDREDRARQADPLGFRTTPPVGRVLAVRR